MKMVNIFHAISVILITGFFSQAQENKNVAVSNFNGVSVSNGIDIYLTQSNSEHVKISAHPDLLKNVIIEKEGGILMVKYKDNISWGRLFKGQSIKVYINYKVLKSVTASGGSDVIGENELKTDQLSIVSSGGSDVSLSIHAKELKVQSSGGSDINLKGTATNMDITATGGSDVEALNLVSDYAKVRSSGGSDANIQVTKALDAMASGGSDIKYKGNASVKNASSKSGDVSRIQ